MTEQTERADVETLGSDLLAYHGDYHVNEDGWTVCVCGHVSVDDDDDGSHARHVATVVLASDWLAADRAAAEARGAERIAESIEADRNRYVFGDRGLGWGEAIDHAAQLARAAARGVEGGAR